MQFCTQPKVNEHKRIGILLVWSQNIWKKLSSQICCISSILGYVLLILISLFIKRIVSMLQKLNESGTNSQIAFTCFVFKILMLSFFLFGRFSFSICSSIFLSFLFPIFRCSSDQMLSKMEIKTRIKETIQTNQTDRGKTNNAGWGFLPHASYLTFFHQFHSFNEQR